MAALTLLSAVVVGIQAPFSWSLETGKAGVGGFGNRRIWVAVSGSCW